MNQIPIDPASCSTCRRQDQVCPYHGVERREYHGPDAYQPSSWVRSVVGGRYSSSSGPVAVVGYDPRHGFWIKDETSGEERNVSERAIDRSLHRIE